MRYLSGLIIWIFLFSWAKAQTVVYVAADGSGEFSEIQEAIDASRAFAPGGVTIHLAPGTYKEKIVVPTWMTNLSILGEDPRTTTISWDDHSGKGDINTFTSYTLKVSGNDFYAENITIENTAGRDAGQAVALHVEGDRVQFYNCRIIGDQDTLYAGTDNSRQYYKDCLIEGTTDFIFGPSTAVFQDCKIICKKNSYITAASTTKKQEFGFVFIDCSIVLQDPAEKVYLGRPWRDYAQTVFIRTEMPAGIRPEGWHNWKRPEAEKTAFYAEYGSYGNGANKDNRVDWSNQLSKKDLKKYNLENIFSMGSKWIPQKINKP